MEEKKIINNKVETEMDINPDEKYNVFLTACQNGYDISVAKMLLEEKIDPSAKNNIAIRIASAHNRIKIVKMLLEDDRVDPGVKNNETIRLTIKYGYIDIAEILLKDSRINLSNRDDLLFLETAKRNNWIKIKKILIINKKKKLIYPSYNV